MKKRQNSRLPWRSGDAGARRLEGWTAIEYAEKHGGTLKKYADPTERALKRMSIDKAKRVAREDSRLVYLDLRRGGKRKRKNPVRVSASLAGKSTGWIKGKAVRVTRTRGGGFKVDVKR